jgi:hypothetical protein
MKTKKKIAKSNKTKVLDLKAKKNVKGGSLWNEPNYGLNLPNIKGDKKGP